MRGHSYKYTAQGWQRAIEFFEKAIALESDYALAYAGIAASRGCQWFFGILPADRVIPQCKAGNAQALASDDGLADAYLSLAMTTFFYDWDWRGAERTFIRSIELNLALIAPSTTSDVRRSDGPIECGLPPLGRPACVEHIAELDLFDGPPSDGSVR